MDARVKPEHDSEGAVENAQSGAMTPLGRTLAARIERFGPLTLAEYMAAALTDPEGGYYMSGDPFGAGGDFVTAPEVSQMFGELIGLWCADLWQRGGAPDPVWLVELGPGRGTLMADALRAARGLPGFLAAARLALVEVSPALRARQAETLADCPLAQAPLWLEHAGALPEGPAIVIANEFFDALPLRQLERGPEGWRERLVVTDPRGLALAPGPPSPALAELVPLGLRDAPPGTVAELCPAGLGLAAWLGARIAETGGGALIVDYGPARPSGRATLQALRGHRRVDILEAPGAADLTAHVDFSALAEAAGAAGARCHGPVPQGAFLKALGIEARAAALCRGAEPAQRASIEAALDRLTSAAGMGDLFKALAVTPASLDSPAGFA